MAIVYGLVSRGSTVFCEYTTQSGNFQQITRNILQQFDTSGDGKHSYTYDDHIFHMIVDHGIIYLAMASAEFERRVAFVFLEDIKERFEDKYSEVVATAVAYEMNKTFTKVLQERMEFYNENPEADKIRKVKGQVEEVKQVMTDTIDKILDRGDKIELLVDKSGELSEQANKFKKSSAQLQRRMWWNNFKLQAIMIGSGVIILMLIVMGSTKCFGHC
mmetsp:Transcript_1684/g.2724  ORF Transcript_1684/g.2724 Transcript_1684/m.2724 type:complete len:217 (+) Transcript_1684:87-737(+)|eukprot:CAMPEP_0184319214 /NCGR_PEP_ID=MMETSP1049-20130417/107103_1 /TAXON_ID=77928 /ORGANISM="Proteomonas sulcata, Strain CCMP704" /LENGTH=216 /DNA_ID=CAMNT_0026639267 /DNA_START=82 /DNA_END=732 /DNA_ORIENTATION=+